MEGCEEIKMDSSMGSWEGDSYGLVEGDLAEDCVLVGRVIGMEICWDLATEDRMEGC
jgi:hypothetical protein